jgi:hypothetical protein
MDDFLASCQAAADFPRNLVYHDTYEHNLTAYEERLGKREEQLFSADESANLELEEHDFQNHSTVSRETFAQSSVIQSLTSIY